MNSLFRPKSNLATIRLEGTVSFSISGDNCWSCHLRKEVFGAHTNLGYVHLCRDCLSGARKKTKRKPQLASNEAQKTRTDAKKYGMPASFKASRKC